MKTAMIARFVMGAAAIFAAAGLAGCGAETGQGPGEQIGSSSEALTINGSPAGTLTSNSQERQFAGSCLLTDSSNGTKYYLMAGGIDLHAGSATTSILKSTNGTSFSAASVSLGTARVNPVGLAADANTCVFVGGALSVGGTPSGAVDVVTVAGGVFSHTTATSLNVARDLLAVSTCGTKLIAIGGRGASAAVPTIEVSDAFNPTSWTRYDSGLTPAAPANSWLQVARYNFALAKDRTGGGEQYILGGGKDASGNLLDTFEVIKTSSCVPTTKVFSGLMDVKLPSVVEGNVAFFEGTNSGTTSTDFVFAAGRSSTSALVTTAKRLTVTWSGPTLTAVSTASITGAYRPILAIDSSKDHVIGGSSANEGTGLTLVQQYASNAWNGTTVNLTEAHYGGVAVPLSGVIYVASGDKLTGSPTWSRTIDEVTP